MFALENIVCCKLRRLRKVLYRWEKRSKGDVEHYNKKTLMDKISQLEREAEVRPLDP